MKLTPPVELVSPPDPAAWDNLVASSDTATIFHTSAWARFWIAEWPGARWEAVVLADGTGYAGAPPRSFPSPGGLCHEMIR